DRETAAWIALLKCEGVCRKGDAVHHPSETIENMCIEIAEQRCTRQSGHNFANVAGHEASLIAEGVVLAATRSTTLFGSRAAAATIAPGPRSSGVFSSRVCICKRAAESIAGPNTTSDIARPAPTRPHEAPPVSTPTARGGTLERPSFDAACGQAATSFRAHITAFSADSAGGRERPNTADTPSPVNLSTAPFASNVSASTSE